MDKSDNLAVDLHHAIILLGRMLRESAGSELTAPQRSILSRLVQDGPHSLGQLAMAEQVTPPSITRTVQQLERKKLVIRKSGSDKRISLLDYTSRAWTLLEKEKTDRTHILHQYLSDLRTSELDLLQDCIPVLHKIIAAQRVVLRETSR